MTLKERIHDYMTGREDEFVAALAPLIAVNSVTGEAAPGMPFGPGPAEALEKALALAESWGFRTWDDEGYVGLVELNEKEDLLHILAHLDIVGAGDSTSAGFVLGLTRGLSRRQAAMVGCCVSSITIQQIGTTGTATVPQVLTRLEKYLAGESV